MFSLLWSDAHMCLMLPQQQMHFGVMLFKEAARRSTGPVDADFNEMQM